MDVCLDCLSQRSSLGIWQDLLLQRRLLFSHLAGISSGGNHLVRHGICHLLAAYMKKRIWKIKYFR